MKISTIVVILAAGSAIILNHSVLGATYPTNLQTIEDKIDQDQQIHWYQDPATLVRLAENIGRLKADRLICHSPENLWSARQIKDAELIVDARYKQLDLTNPHPIASVYTKKYIGSYGADAWQDTEKAEFDNENNKNQLNQATPICDRIHVSVSAIMDTVSGEAAEYIRIKDSVDAK